ncbi:hypothetical protein CPB84DRAFT_1212513 [Gymnopilus junonius]|uniref:Uncharacterized protein n=1 Tax=Gymnopilus junonius TaxID=109634 RepID=A0A9P5NIU5_GYMJU|nr:hypothetical protein CPB84DRAFT_1212513 [Gymnopilus junonius]
MSSLISPSRCLRVNHLQLQQLEPHTHRHMHRLVRASAEGSLNRAICIGKPFNPSRFHKRGLHSSFRVEFSEPKDRLWDASSSRVRTERPSRSISTPSSRPPNYDSQSHSFRSNNNSNSNYNSKPNYNSQSSYNSSSNYTSKPNYNNPNYNSRNSSPSSSSSPSPPQTSRWQSQTKPVPQSHWQLRGRSQKNKQMIAAAPLTAGEKASKPPSTGRKCPDRDCSIDSWASGFSSLPLLRAMVVLVVLMA